MRSENERLLRTLTETLGLVDQESVKMQHLEDLLGDHLTQWDDFTELHQNEMIGMKTQIGHTVERIERVEYPLVDQSIDINECVDTGDHSGTIVHSCWADSTCVNSGKRLNGVFQNVPTRVIHFSWDIFL